MNQKVKVGLHWLTTVSLLCMYTYTWKDCAPTPTVDFIDQLHMIRFNNLTLCKQEPRRETGWGLCILLPIVLPKQLSSRNKSTELKAAVLRRMKVSPEFSLGDCVIWLPSCCATSAEIVLMHAEGRWGETKPLLATEVSCEELCSHYVPLCAHLVLVNGEGVNEKPIIHRYDPRCVISLLLYVFTSRYTERSALLCLHL